MKQISGYQRRLLKNNGRDKYGSFREGKQLTADKINGKNVWIPFTHLAS